VPPVLLPLELLVALASEPPVVLPLELPAVPPVELPPLLPLEPPVLPLPLLLEELVVVTTAGRWMGKWQRGMSPGRLKHSKHALQNAPASGSHAAP
jgi:hypothetical protein